MSSISRAVYADIRAHITHAVHQHISGIVCRAYVDAGAPVWSNLSGKVVPDNHTVNSFFVAYEF